MANGKIGNSEGFLLAGEAHILATRPGDEEPTVSALLAAESLIVQNKANWEEVSSLKFRVSSSGPALQTQHVTVHTPLKPPYGVSRACRAKQSQFEWSFKFEVSSVKWEGPVAKNKANCLGPSPLAGDGLGRDNPTVQNKANLSRWADGGLQSS